MINYGRRALSALGTLSAFGVTSHSDAQATSDNAYSDKVAAGRWMRALLDAPGSVTKPLYFGRFQDPMYFLLDEIGWQPSGTQKAFAPVTAPKGFVTDLASIPRAFWSALRPDGSYAYAAILHDYLYWFQPIPREDADLIFKYAMEDTGVNAAVVTTIHTAVRVGGDTAWNDNKALKAGGERRILVKYPDSPSITWEIWKTRQGVLK